MQLAAQLVEGQPASDDLRHRQPEAVEVVHLFPVVVAKRLLIQIPEQVKRFDRYVSAVDSALEQAPIVFQPVGVNLSIDVFDGVVDDLMRVVSGGPSYESS